jgi:hypothetical protein
MRNSGIYLFHTPELEAIAHELVLALNTDIEGESFSCGKRGYYLVVFDDLWPNSAPGLHQRANTFVAQLDAEAANATQ